MPKLTERATTALKLAKTSPKDWAGAGAIGLGAGALSGSGIAASAAGLVGVSTATGGIALLVVGATLLAPTIYRVFNPRRREKHLKNELSSDDVEYEFWNCRIFNIAVVGPRGTGKTTVKHLLRGLPTDGIKSTDGTEYHLFRVGKSDKFGVLIDGAGAVDTFGDQAKLARNANILIVVFDHFNTRDLRKEAEKSVDKKRLKSHESFAKNFFDRLNKATPSDLRGVVLLMTKKDLWMNGPDRKAIEQWMAKLQTNIKKDHASYLPDPLIFQAFDRASVDDLMWLVDQLQIAVNKR